MNDQLLTLKEAAEYLRLPEATLRWYRTQGKGPKGFKSGRRVVYRLHALEAFLADAEAAEVA